MNISGVLVRTHSYHVDIVSASLQAITGVEVHACNPDGRMVVTIEADNAGRSTELFSQISNVDRVLSTSVVYNCFDEADG